MRGCPGAGHSSPWIRVWGGKSGRGGGGGHGMGQALSSPDIIPNAAVTPTMCREAVQAQGLSAWSPSVTKAGRARRWVLREAEGSSLEILPSPPRGLLFGQDPPFLPKNKGRKPGPRQPCPQRIGNTGSKETNATSAWAQPPFCIGTRPLCARKRGRGSWVPLSLSAEILSRCQGWVMPALLTSLQ